MRIIASTGNPEVAMVYIAELSSGNLVECVESLQPPLPREEKWVLLVSTMFGCPVGCKMCDAGGFYHGKPSKEEIFEQLDFLIRQRYPNGRVPSEQFKIQFARMGEPALNMQVLDVLDELPRRYHVPGLMPSISSVAPKGTLPFFERLLEIKNRHYRGGNFQFQFSIHTTDLARRDALIPVKKWSFAEMAAFGEKWLAPGDRKVTLNFALAADSQMDPQVLLEHFSPDTFLIKITPLNPTYRAAENGMISYIDPNQQAEDYAKVEALRRAGYEVIVSIGEVEENRIGSNCGQYLRTHLRAAETLRDGYTYQIEECQPA
jgi:23S rRNA (adenine2503-C2)-methyltransferase